MEVRKFLKLAAPVLFVLLSLVFAVAPASADEKMKTGTTTTQLHSVSCVPECGFRVQSHDTKELISIVKAHAKKAHNKESRDRSAGERDDEAG
jgi:predicted small metal-binding protein